MKRFASLGVVIGMILLIYTTGLYRALHFETIRYHYVELIEYVNNNPLLSPFMFIGTTAITTLPFISGKALFNSLGGYLFPQPWGILYFLTGLTLGGVMLFISVKKALDGKKVGWMKKVEKGFNKHPTSYLLFFRLCPFIPFWLTSLIPAFLNVRLRTFVWTTLLGSVPGALLFAKGGKGLNVVFESSEKLLIHSNGPLILTGLALVALLPIFFKR